MEIYAIMDKKDFSSVPIYMIAFFMHTQGAFGGLAQRESACLTSKMSQVQSLYPPTTQLLAMQGVFLYHFTRKISISRSSQPSGRMLRHTG